MAILINKCDLPTALPAKRVALALGVPADAFVAPERAEELAAAVRKETAFSRGGAGSGAANEYGLNKLAERLGKPGAGNDDRAELELRRLCEQGSLCAFRCSVLAGQGYGHAVRWIAQKLKERSEAISSAIS